MTDNTVRGIYGEILNPEIRSAGRSLIEQAVKAGKLTAEYFERHSRKRATALNYDVYDRLGGQWLIQQRQTEIDKYGAHPTKYYYLLRRVGRGIEVTEVVNKSTANRAARQAAKLGDAIRVLRGEKKLTGKKQERGTYYKAVALVDGQYHSIYDNSTIYEIGKTKTQRAQSGHNGGYYVYRTEREARECEVPSNSDNLSAPRVILKCECSGKSVAYDSGKIAFTHLTPVEVLAF